MFGMEEQTRVIIFGVILTLMTIKSHGQCSFLDGKFEAGHGFKKNIRHGLDPQKESEKDELISLVKIDSIGSTNQSWYAAILFHNKPTGQVDVEFEFQNKKTIKAKGQRPQLLRLDTIYFEDNELVFPIDRNGLELIRSIDIISIRINAEVKHVTFHPEKNLLKRMTKCLM